MYIFAKKGYTNFESPVEFVIEYSIFYTLNQWALVKLTFRYIVVLLVTILWITNFRFRKSLSCFFARRSFLLAIAIFLFLTMLFRSFVICDIFWAGFVHWLIRIKKFSCFRKRYNFFIWRNSKAFFT